MNKLNKIIRSSINYLFSYNYTFRYLLSKMYRSDEKFIKLLYKLRMNKELDLEDPQTFSEKLQWLKLYNREPIMTTMVDKVEAKKYVANIIGEEYIIPTIGVYNLVEEIDFDALPNQFVIKCTHDSGGLVICKDKSKLDIKKAKSKLSKALKTNFYYQNREWPYKDVNPRIIAEQLLEIGGGGDLPDYKFFCFNGEPKCCQVISGRSSTMTIDFFDEEWNHLQFHEPRQYPFSVNPILKPESYSQMWQLARKLSLGHPFLRVDFYEINGKIYFGELTFYPTSGMGGFDPEEWDYIFGNWIQLPKR